MEFKLKLLMSLLLSQSISRNNTDFGMPVSFEFEIGQRSEVISIFCW